MTSNASSALRVMQFSTTLECGGTERQVLNLGLDLHRRGVDVRLGCLRRAGRLLSEIEAERIPVQEYFIRSLYSRGAARQAMALARDLARDRVDVIHAYNLYGNVFAVPAARLAGVPVVIAGVRDCGLYMTPWKQRAQRVACRFADVILVNAEGVKQWLIDEGYPSERIAVIHNGIDTSRFLDRAVPSDGRVRESLGIPPGVPLLSTVARLCPSKGIEHAIDAMAMICARHPEARLIVAGEALRSTNGDLEVDNSYRERLEARARSLGLGDRVVFVGYRSDVPDLLRQVTVSMQPSLTEGLSNSVLEAMAAGCAVVATPVGGTPEVITDGATGVLTPVGDPRALARAATALLNEPARAEAIGSAARALIHERFSIRAMTEATERLYREWLARKRPRRNAGLRSAVSAS